MRIADPDHDNTTFAGLLPPLLKRPRMRGIAHVVMNVTGLAECESIVRRARLRAAGGPMMPALLAESGITWRITNPDALHVPSSGPLIVVANHPFGVADGMVLHALARQHRPDTRTVVTHALRYVPELADEFLFVDPIIDAERARANAPSLRDAVRHLRAGNTVALFPAGAMMRWMREARRITDAPWSETLGGIVRMTRATVLPIFFHGRNRFMFNALNAVSRDAGLVMMLSEFLARRNSQVELTVGSAIEFEELAGLNDAAIVARLREATLGLERQPAA